MNIILWIIFGALAGWIASLIMKTNQSQGLLMDIVVGIAGAFLGGFVFNLFGATGTTGFNLYSLFVAIVGAIVLLFVVKSLRKV